jgi:hypothetical protein
MNSTQFSTLGLQPSFGFGDRLGLATPGHVLAMQQAGARMAPIFAQQSIREMTRTGRTPDNVVDDACRGMELAGWNKPSGADADHLKTREDVDKTAAAGFTFYTIDPSQFVDDNAESYDEVTLRDRVASLKDQIPWCQSYVNRPVPLASGDSHSITEKESMRCAVKYGLAIEHAIKLAKYIFEVNDAVPRDVELELSIDETSRPTSLAEHFIIADQCRQHGVRLTSLAPRFVGDFEKGVDYKGQLPEFERSLADHAALARELGPYKLSLHSGSDKLSLYAILAKTTRGMFHVKTAGTSYLEALRVVARHDAALFRQIIDAARQFYDRDKATYHVSAQVDALPAADSISSVSELERVYLGVWSEVPKGEGFTEPGRQILHCTFGTLLSHDVLGPRIRQVLTSHAADYT